MINSLRPGDAYIDSSLDQLMACHLSGTKPLPVMTQWLIVYHTTRNNLQRNWNQNMIIFKREIVFSNHAISFEPQWVENRAQIWSVIWYVHNIFIQSKAISTDWQGPKSLSALIWETGFIWGMNMVPQAYNMALNVYIDIIYLWFSARLQHLQSINNQIYWWLSARLQYLHC